MIVDINSTKIKSDKSLSNLFVNANFKNLSINCNILNGNFYSDSFYYFPITVGSKKNQLKFNESMIDTRIIISDIYNQYIFNIKKCLK